MNEQIKKINFKNFDKLLTSFDFNYSTLQKNMLLNRINNHEKDVYVISLDEKFIAMIMVEYNKEYIRLSNLYVLNIYRKKGYGKKLLNYVISNAVLNDYDYVLCNVRENNQIAINMYDEMGFKVNNSFSDSDGVYYSIYKDLKNRNREM